ncbi:MAG: hypothetical protein LBS97_03795 [Treponema sp.]|jgi:hypothetical protein|nr:hypothetical protein [Treponema sp.]
MEQYDIALLALKLALGGVAAFLAIVLWSRLYDAPWMALAGGALTGYAGIVYDVLRAIGVVDYGAKTAWFSPVTVLFTVVPFLFYIAAFVLMLVRIKKTA